VLNELGKATRYCHRVRQLTPYRMVMTLMALFAGTRVESLADLQRGFNALFGYAMDYKPFCVSMSGSKDARRASRVVAVLTVGIARRSSRSARSMASPAAASATGSASPASPPPVTYSHTKMRGISETTCPGIGYRGMSQSTPCREDHGCPLDVVGEGVCRILLGDDVHRFRQTLDRTFDGFLGRLVVEILDFLGVLGKPGTGMVPAWRLS